MKKVLKITANVLVWIILILALLITIMVFSSGRNNGISNLLGYIPMTVESDSMKPTFKKNDLIICKEVDDVYSLKKGDVITFWTIIDGKKVKNTHRIVEVNEFENTRSFVTRGDNNNQDDTMPAYAGDVIGKWTDVKLDGFGKVMNFLRTKTGFFVCIVIPMAVFFLIELYKFVVTLIELKKPQLTDEDEEEIKKRAIEEYLAAQKKEATAEDNGASAEVQVNK
ncbi:MULTISPECIES: signal peptidase I [Ruminococcus]|uniref:Signal peptidase I n=1 Tax=Ruminococcus albus (strain ATCC 27210 / DSM 20455 / JCM 14654 / NCDO 2250 / 7) TaxID=697329 RepID=E6UCT5_RUMA7|nr:MULTISPECIES: signal peptidase I [Ruminococcus]ADU22764.1 peptidase S26B, signal peptidase [Ruminococcus albus 7 = DSM 20455]MCR5022523.1 signal peptidase I [Ruminococcus sp.]